VEDTYREITHGQLLDAADESDVEGASLSFLIDSVSSGSLQKWSATGWTDVVPGTTLIGASERLQWKSGVLAHGSLDAFTVKVHDGELSSSLPVMVRADVAAAPRAPALAAAPLLAGRSDVSVSENIVLVFDKSIQAGLGFIEISDGTDTRRIAITDSSQVSIEGQTLTINPAADLWLSSQSSIGASVLNRVLPRTYSVRLDAGAVKGMDGVAYAGIHDSATLSFTTQSSKLLTLHRSGEDKNRVSMVFVGDGFKADEIGSGEFSTKAQESSDYLFKSGALTQPIGRYASAFNVHALEVASVDSGIDMRFPFASVNTAFDSAQGSLERVLVINKGKGNLVLTAALSGTGITPDAKLAILNTTVYGGEGGEWASYSLDQKSMLIAAHELGHSFGNLYDEYSDGGPPTYMESESKGPNVTTDKSALKWSPWLGQYQEGIGVIGAYEGGEYSVHGIYRPSVDSKMKSMTSAWDLIGREQFILSIYAKMRPLDHVSGVDDRHAVLSATPFDPTLIDLTWSVDGVAVSSTSPWLDLTTLATGTHTITLKAQDNTGWVRRDYLDKVTQTTNWTIDVQPATTLGAGHDDHQVVVNRWVQGGAGNDQLRGSSGNDRLEGGSGDDTLTGHDGDDLLMGSEGVNLLDGGSGVNTVSYQDFTEAVTVSLALSGVQLTSTRSRDTLSQITNLIGGAGGDRLTGHVGPNGLFGMDGNDTLIGGSGNSTLDGGAGDDSMTAGAGNNRIWGGTGNDVIVTGHGNNLIDGGDGNDSITAGNGDNQIRGGSGNDTLRGGSGVNLYLGEQGNDDILGGAGNDTVQGGIGTNALDGGAGVNTLSYADATENVSVSLSRTTSQVTGHSTDTIKRFQNLIGGSGHDVLTGTDFDNTLEGGAGNDTLIGGEGNDICVGGAGNNTASFAGTWVPITATLMPSLATIDHSTGKAIGRATGQGEDTLWQIDNLIGSRSADFLTGDGFANVLTGGEGNDRLTGGGGADTFVMNAPFVVGGTFDSLVDFQTGIDRIHLASTVFVGIGNTASGTIDASRLSQSTSTQTSATRILYDAATGRLSFDADGSAAFHAPVLFAQLLNMPAMLSASDFAVI
jgi:Ca2+-binding RTX toxin-like protein